MTPQRSALLSRLLLAALVLLFTLSSSGCSTVTLAYNNAPFAVNYLLDGYFDLDGPQETLLKERVAAMRDWHRKEQLPSLVRLASEAKTRAGRTVTTEDIVWLQGEMRGAFRVVAERAAPEMVQLAVKLTPENLTAYERRQAKNLRDYERDFIRAPLEARQEKRYERVLSEAERWYGRFDDDKRDRIRALTDALPANYPAVLQERRRRQAELLTILTEASNSKGEGLNALSERLRLWMTEWERGRPAAYAEFSQAYQRGAQRMSVEIAGLASEAQRATAQKRFQALADDLTALQRQ